jgi:hypothetical protein
MKPNKNITEAAERYLPRCVTEIESTARLQEEWSKFRKSAPICCDPDMLRGALSLMKAAAVREGVVDLPEWTQFWEVVRKEGFDPIFIRD